MLCGICGDEQHLTGPRRWWSPDDGWRFTRLCQACAEDLSRPCPEDYAWDRRGEDMDVDEIIDAIYG